MGLLSRKLYLLPAVSTCFLLMCHISFSDNNKTGTTIQSPQFFHLLDHHVPRCAKCIDAHFQKQRQKRRRQQRQHQHLRRPRLLRPAWAPAQPRRASLPRTTVGGATRRRWIPLLRRFATRPPCFWRPSRRSPLRLTRLSQGRREHGR